MEFCGALRGFAGLFGALRGLAGLCGALRGFAGLCGALRGFAVKSNTAQYLGNFTSGFQ